MPTPNTKYVHIHLKLDLFPWHMSKCYNMLQIQWSLMEHLIFLRHCFFKSSFLSANLHKDFLILHRMEALLLFSIACSPFGNNKNGHVKCDLMFLKLLLLYYLLLEKIHLIHFLKIYLIVVNQRKYCFNSLNHRYYYLTIWFDWILSLLFHFQENTKSQQGLQYHLR